MAALLDKLEAMALIGHEALSSDKRAATVRLTAAGKTLPPPAEPRCFTSMPSTSRDFPAKKPGC
ncbi:MarR family winged helix-turn-helix transcriptional regulator [Xanthomonas arboricola]|uniref:Uncharacterized protein n=1 Tax=Xanthomonas arboricola pv. guizotiae TaxID=487867 RepID=A0A2S7A496_9XANT|nr:MarR family winged helix-turn-helix transcriptional regulator [Xanthomonas arboricola]PPU01469.1 hypothetical protein XarbCFBP7409_07215 [Xanthomonas arboricola pv. guizotiae]PPU23325.1 hypothetical protein XarbCFBP7408_11780 [Xanthomonas arboricola pv. guizotiae]